MKNNFFFGKHEIEKNGKAEIVRVRPTILYGNESWWTLTDKQKARIDSMKVFKKNRRKKKNAQDKKWNFYTKTGNQNDPR